MELSEKIMLNQFIAKIGVIYNDKKQVYIDSKGQEIQNINNYIKACYKRCFNKIITKEQQAYIEQWLYAPFNFDDISYKTYLKSIVEFQNPKKIRNLKDNYDYYLESIQNSNKSKQCIYISGKSGSGKTTYAKILASKYFDEDEIFISSGGSHPFDEYYGEKCIIIDDFRDSVIAYNDLLRLLDNNTSSNVGARYHNKSLARCELIILTSVKNPLNLYNGIDEERYQLYRRMTYFDIEQETLYLMEYDKLNDNYHVSGFINIEKEMKKYFENNKNNCVINIEKMFQSKLEEMPEEIIENLF